ncbi:F-box domain-containing protein [Mycena venus]|uniref:F-box domain-containing protein n=1 Tax=Mycena venus TaxID=2733690 RepID=A0A8H6WUT9_9AGAR|nr:F-box domain-containing protein [Mycena venus]
MSNPYPVLTLPFDIISQIFVYCLPPEDDALPWRTEAPLLLAGICRDWRDVALTVHELWNTIHLSLRPRSILKVAPLLKFWVPRAGNLPLSMSLVYKSEGSDTAAATRTLEELLDVYAPHWSSIELKIPLPTLIGLSPPEEDLASLRKLVLDLGAGWLTNRDKQLGDVFSKAPKMCELHIISGPSAKLALPWEQLTTLRLDNASRAECLRTLALVPKLVNFTVTLWAGSPGVSGSVLPPLSRLKSLTFTLSHTRGPALLHSLTLPALHHLALELQSLPEITSVTSLITRSPCFLRRLSVRMGLGWTADYFMQLFVTLDSLEELEIKKASQSLDTGLGLLKVQPHLLPNLRSLSVERTFHVRENAELLADLLESRWNIPATVSLPVQLKSFRLDSPLTEAPDADSRAVLRLARLRAEGMKIQIRSSFWSWFY